MAIFSRDFCLIMILLSACCFLCGFIIQVHFHIVAKNEYVPQLRKNQIVKPIKQDDKTELIVDGLVISESKVKELIANNEKLKSLVKYGVMNAKTFNYSQEQQHINFDNAIDVPNIVNAWRKAKLDWHALLPLHNSIWERFGTPQKEGKLRQLVSKETLITDYLTRFVESGLSTKYGKQYGNLQAYSGCNIFQSSCMIHNEELCTLDQFCRWSSDLSLCVDGNINFETFHKMFNNPDHSKTVEDIYTNFQSSSLDSPNHQQCSNPRGIKETGFYPITNANDFCKVWIHDPTIFISIDSESQSMFYHWWATWSSIVSHWESNRSNRNVHYLVGTINDPMFFNYFGFLSNNCWRRAQETFNVGHCFCNALDLDATQSRDHTKDSASLMINYLDLNNIQPPRNKVKIGIISRRRKRFILNEYELMSVVLSLGFECELLPLESMTTYEQMYALRTLDVLIGIHGSALDNTVFLHPGSVMVQLLPYKVEHRISFPASAGEAGVKYMEWQLKDPTKAVFHWDLLDQANSERLKTRTKQQILDGGQVAADARETMMFWINQDVIVPIDEWKELVIKAAIASQASQRGIVLDQPH